MDAFLVREGEGAWGGGVRGRGALKMLHGGCAGDGHPGVLADLLPAGKNAAAARAQRASKVGKGSCRVGKEHDAEA